MQKSEERSCSPIYLSPATATATATYTHSLWFPTSPFLPSLFFFFFLLGRRKNQAKKKKKKGTKVTFNPFQSRDTLLFTLFSTLYPLPIPQTITNWLAISYWLNRFKKAGESPSSGTGTRSDQAALPWPTRHPYPSIHLPAYPLLQLNTRSVRVCCGLFLFPCSEASTSTLSRCRYYLPLFTRHDLLSKLFGVYYS